MSSPFSIETERLLLLRSVTLADPDEFARVHEDSEVARFMGSPDRAWPAEWVEGNQREWSGSLR